MSGISKRDYRRQRFYGVPNPSSVTAYEKLNDWQRELGECLQSARSQRDLPPYSIEDLLVKIADWGRVLDRAQVPIYGLSFCFERAIGARGRGDGPFEAGEVANEWRNASIDRRTELFQAFNRDHALTGPPCEWCAGSGFVHVDQDGKELRRSECQTGVAVKRCRHTGFVKQEELWDEANQ